MHDDELIKKCLYEEDGSAWEIFVEKYSGLIWNSIHKTLYLYYSQYSKEDIEDIYSSVFLSLVDNDFKKLRQFRGENACTLQTWLTIITVRMTIDYLRKNKGHLSVEAAEKDEDIFESIPDKKDSAEKIIEGKQMSEKLKKSLEILSTQDRIIYDLLFNREFSPEEAAKILGVSPANIYSRKHRIIEKIKKNINEM